MTRKRESEGLWASYDKHRAVRVLFAGLILVFFALMFLPFAAPILMAVLFSFALEPILSKYAGKRSKRRLPTAIILACLFCGITFPVAFVSWRVVAKVNEYSAMGLQNVPVYQTLKETATAIGERLSDFGERVNLDSGAVLTPATVLEKAGPVVVAATTKFVAQFPEFMLSFLVFCAVLYFLLTESKDIKRSILGLNLLTPTEVNQIIRVVQRSSYTALVATTILGMVQSLCVALAALACGYREFLIVFLLTFLFSFIPVIGAAPMAILLSLLSFAQREVPQGIGLMVAAGVAGSADNLLRPYLVSSSEDELNPVIALLAVIGAIIYYGIPGLLLGPILIQLAIKIVPILLGQDHATDDKSEVFHEPAK